jgi:hypothetical protein
MCRVRIVIAKNWEYLLRKFIEHSGHGVYD